MTDITGTERPSDELPARTPEAQTAEQPDDTDVDIGRTDSADEPDHETTLGAVVDLVIGRIPDEQDDAANA